MSGDGDNVERLPTSARVLDAEGTDECEPGCWHCALLREFTARAIAGHDYAGALSEMAMALGCALGNLPAAQRAAMKACVLEVIRDEPERVAAILGADLDPARAAPPGGPKDSAA